MTRSLLAVALIAVCMPQALAQEPNPLATLLARTPHTMQLKQFNATWLRVSVKQSDAGAAGTGDMLSKLAQIGMMADGGKMKGDGMEAALGLSMLGGMGGGPQRTCFTQGQTLAIGSETFLVAYAVEQKSPNLLQMIMEAEQSGKEPDMAALFGGSKWTEDTVASLTLINVRAIHTLSGVRPFDLQKELAEGGECGLDLMQLMMLGMSKTAEAPPAPAKPQTQKPAVKPKAK